MIQTGDKRHPLSPSPNILAAYLPAINILIIIIPSPDPHCSNVSMTFRGAEERLFVGLAGAVLVA